MDIKAILNALSSEDKTIWQKRRTCMRSAYINAHNDIVGVQDWNADDDAMLDLIDIKIATLFDRAGRIETAEDIIPKAEAIEESIKKAAEGIGKIEASQLNDKLNELMRSSSPWDNNKVAER